MTFSVTGVGRLHLLPLMLLLPSTSLLAPPVARAEDAAGNPPLPSRSIQMSWTGKAAGWAPVPFERFRNEILFKARINGVDASVLLDNGAESTLVDEGFARKAGLAPGAAGPGLDTGSATLTSHRLDKVTFDIPHHLLIAGTLNAADLQPVSRVLGRQVDAILGGDLLDRLMVGVMTSEHALLLLPSGSASFKEGAITLPLLDGNRIEAEIENQPVRLKIDLGSNGVVSLNQQGWRRVIWADKPVEETRSSALEGVKRKELQSLHHEVKLGPINARDVTVGQNHSAADGKEDGHLGGAFFAQFDAVLDVSAKTLTLIPLKPATPADAPKPATPPMQEAPPVPSS